MVFAIGVVVLGGSALTLTIGWIVAGRRDKAARAEAETEADTVRTLDETIAIVREIGEPS